MRRSNISGVSEAGPIVATILVLFKGSAIKAFSLANPAVIELDESALRPPEEAFTLLGAQAIPFSSRVQVKNDVPFDLTLCIRAKQPSLS